MTKLQSFEMLAYRKMVKISRWREKKTNEEVLKLADEQLYNSNNKEKKNYLYRSTGGENKQSKAKNGVELMTNITEWTGMRRRRRETGSRPGVMEDHDSQPSFKEDGTGLE